MASGKSIFSSKYLDKTGKKNPHLSKSLYKNIMTKSTVFARMNIVFNTRQMFIIKGVVNN